MILALTENRIIKKCVEQKQVYWQRVGLFAGSALPVYASAHSHSDSTAGRAPSGS